MRPHLNDIYSDNILSDIQKLLTFIKFDDKQRDAMRMIHDLLDQELPIALDIFYDQVNNYPDIQSFFSSQEQISHARDGQIAHWKNISKADFGIDYTNKVRAIGKVHARIGLDPNLYVGSYSIILDHLIRSIFIFFPSQGRFFSKKSSSEQFSNALSALCKAVLLDISLSISVYLEESEKEREKARIEIITREKKQENLIKNLKIGLRALAKGDLGFRFETPFESEFEELREDFNSAACTLASTLEKIPNSIVTLENGIEEISHASDDFARRTEHQATDLSEMAASVQSVSMGVEQTARNMFEANRAAEDIKKAGVASNHIAQDTLATMRKIEESSMEISSIINLIDQITAQTRILSINASIEASKSGEFGRGFAIISEQIRNLANRSAISSEKIRIIILNSADHIHSGVKFVDSINVSLKDMTHKICNISRVMSQVCDLSQEQAHNLSVINQTIANINQTTQQNAAMVEQSNAATHTFSQEAKSLSKAMCIFKLR